MEFEFETHWQCMLVLPHLSVQCAQCEDTSCHENHWLWTFGWLFWTLEVYVD